MDAISTLLQSDCALWAEQHNVLKKISISSAKQPTESRPRCGIVIASFWHGISKFKIHVEV